MARVVFYEKPGCQTNKRQKQVLVRAGHEVVAKDLLREPWTGAALLAFLDGLPVSDWFNKAAPAVKSGEVDPDGLDREAALACLLADPLLIRRPLLEVGDGRLAGFDADLLATLIGLEDADTGRDDLEGCSHANPGPETRCPDPVTPHAAPCTEGPR